MMTEWGEWPRMNSGHNGWRSSGRRRCCFCCPVTAFTPVNAANVCRHALAVSQFVSLQFVSSSVCQFSASQPGNQQTNKLTLLEPKSVAAREGKEREAPRSKLYIPLGSTKIVENKIYGCPKTKKNKKRIVSLEKGIVLKKPLLTLRLF